ncbi:MAG: hypothetical protein KAU22_12430 [Desulfuromonadales bacterium]|nr:hypothetical protein [Desulfuromonadales bacterium]
MKYISVFFLVIFCFTGMAIAGEADVIAVKVKQTDKQSYRFDVTVRHADQGWDHYADRWEVLAADGSILDTRVLAHPHTNEQPFTRSLSGVMIPVDTLQVTIRAHDSVHDFGGETMVIDLD